MQFIQAVYERGVFAPPIRWICRSIPSLNSNRGLSRQSRPPIRRLRQFMRFFREVMRRARPIWPRDITSINHDASVAGHGWFAGWNRSDQWHLGAKRAMDNVIASGPVQFSSTSFILLECGNAAARRPFRREVDLLRQRLEAQNQLILPTEATSWAALRFTRRRRSRC
jgi:hypothetical protein